MSYNATGGNGSSSFEVVVPVGTSEAEICLTRHAAGLGLETLELLVDVTDGLHRSQVTIVLHIQDLSQGRTFASSLLQATVTDTSIAPGQALVFSILGTGIYTVSVYPSTFTAFTVSQPKSEIQINTPLNAATTPNYHFMLRLNDGTTNSARFVQVRIVISPSRNYYPPVLPSSFFVREVPEGNYQAPVLLTRIAATDKDTPVRSDAQRVIHSSSNSAPFNYDSVGCLRVIKSVDYDNGQRNYSKQLVARNNLHSNRLQDTADLLIIVTEANDHTPLFPLPAYSAVLLENATVSSLPFLTVTATDSDVGTSGDLSYALLDDVKSGGGNFDYVTFQVNSSTGEIHLAQSLDREQEHIYQLVLVAQDGGNPGRSARVPIHIEILDVNDNDPVFPVAEYNVKIAENLPPHIALVNLQATDADSSLFGPVTYSLDGSVASSLFFINATSGEILSNSTFDREVMSVWRFSVIARDSSNREASVLLVVNIADVNDNPPVFVSVPTRFNLSRFLPTGFTAGRVVATDADQVFDNVTYTLLSENTDEILVIDQKTGAITVSRQPGTLVASEYNVTVSASDGELSVNHTVEVYYDFYGNFCTSTGMDKLHGAGVVSLQNMTD